MYLRYSGQSARITASLICCAAMLSTLCATESDDFPDPGVHWRSPVADPLSGLSYAVGNTITLQASIVDLGLVSEVAFLVDGSEVGSDMTPPYTFDWVVAGDGDVTLTAEARAGSQALSSSDLIIRAINDGIFITPNEAEITLPANGTTTLSLTLGNRGPQARDWATHIWGGTAAIGDAGEIVSDRTYNRTFAAGANKISNIQFRDFGTSTTDDDELWLPDTGLDDEERRRYTISPWTEQSLFKSAIDLRNGTTFSPQSDNLWTLTFQNGTSQVAQLRTNNGKVLKRINEQDYTPPLNDPQFGGSPINFYHLAAAPGVFYRLFRDPLNNIGNASSLGIVQLREQDLDLISFQTTTNIAGVSTDREGDELIQLQRSGQMAWSTGHLWFVGFGDRKNEKNLRLHRWRPGDENLSLVDTIDTTAKRPWSSIAPSAEDGLVWIAHTDGNTSKIRLVDTGMRSWISTPTVRGTISNGAETEIDFAVDGSDLPEGVYTAEVVFTQHPGDDIVQMTIPVTLTVTAGGERTITIGSLDNPNVFWSIDPADGQTKRQANQDVFEKLNPNADYTLTPQSAEMAERMVKCELE